MRAWNFNDDIISQRVASGEPATTCCGLWCVEMQATGKMQFLQNTQGQSSWEWQQIRLQPPAKGREERAYQREREGEMIPEPCRAGLLAADCVLRPALTIPLSGFCGMDSGHGVVSEEQL